MSQASLSEHGQWSDPLPLNLALTSSLKDIEGDHGVVVHDDRVVALDEAHAAHIRCQIEDMVSSLADFLAVIENAQIHQVELMTEDLLLNIAYAC